MDLTGRNVTVHDMCLRRAADHMTRSAGASSAAM